MNGCVWVVMKGEYCEGGSVQAVFLHSQSAGAYVEKNFPTFKRVGEWCWENGCDEITVERYDVRTHVDEAI